MKIALCLIVKPDDKEAELLGRCLSFVAGHVDGIYITITGRNKKVEDVCKFYNANISYFTWINDFSAARNFNFKQVPKEYEYIFWIDADDAVRGIEKLKETVEKNKDVDCFSMFYLYAFDEWKKPIVVHHKTRVIRNDGCVEWKGHLHEDFVKNREIKQFHIKDIDVLHLSDVKRHEESKKRNLKIAKEDLKVKPDDPRSYWNVGNSLKALGKNKEAIKMFDKFLERSKSEDEKYIVRLRRAESFMALNKNEKAIDEVRYAVGTKPEYPDAYMLLGTIYFNLGQYEKAKDNYLLGLTKKPPIYEIIVYNPRDYDYVPLMNLAKTYFNLSQPIQALKCLESCREIYPEDKNLKRLTKRMRKEANKQEEVLKIVEDLRKIKDKKKLKKAFDDIPVDFKSHPAVCNLRNIHFVKKTCDPKDISIFCGISKKVWTPETAKTTGVGGSEEALFWLTKLLVQRGWNVTVYNNCGHQSQAFDGVIYKPFWEYNYRDKQNIVILWRSPSMLDYDINAERIYVDLHDALQEGEFNEKRVAKLDKIFVKSKFQRSLYPKVSDDKFVIVPNGIDSAVFKKEVKRDPYLIINTGSPDRSLSALLDCFKRVKEEIPEAKCKWAYGWDIFDIAHGDDLEVMKWKKEMVEKIEATDGFEALGRVNTETVTDLYLKAGIYGYPSEFGEIDCMSITKAQAAGALPVATDFSAVGEKVDTGGIFVHSDKTKDTWSTDYQFDFAMKDKKMQDQWVNHVIALMLEPPNEEDLWEMRKEAHEIYDWETIVDVWDKELRAGN